MSDHAISTLLDEERRFPPDPAFAAEAVAKPEIYDRDPDVFWESEGRERVSWFEPFETLSGGQQARLQILLLELAGSTLLLLDEPTDNLDLASAEALEEAGVRVVVIPDSGHSMMVDQPEIFVRELAIALRG